MGLTGGDMAVRLYTCEGDTGQWTVIQSADEANWQGTGIATRVRDDCFTAIDRSLLEFATSGYEAPLEARLYLHDANADRTGHTSVHHRPAGCASESSVHALPRV